MKKLLVHTMLLFFIVFMSSCQAIGEIFKAGVWVGVLGVVFVVGLIIYLVTRNKN
jgi:hypothetical protein